MKCVTLLRLFKRHLGLVSKSPLVCGYRSVEASPSISAEGRLRQTPVTVVVAMREREDETFLYQRSPFHQNA
jgi:hypothetical protein